MQAIIICGGKGLRLKTISKNTPKALVKLNRKENLKNQIEILKKNGINNFLFLVNNFEKEIEIRNGVTPTQLDELDVFSFLHVFYLHDPRFQQRSSIIDRNIQLTFHPVYFSILRFSNL